MADRRQCSVTLKVIGKLTNSLRAFGLMTLLRAVSEALLMAAYMFGRQKAHAVASLFELVDEVSNPCHRMGLVFFMRRQPDCAP